MNSITSRAKFNPGAETMGYPRNNFEQGERERCFDQGYRDLVTPSLEI